MDEVPLLPSLVAVIVALPADWPETRPLELTVATEALLVDHVTTRPLRVAPVASLVTAESCCVAPTRMVADGGFTVTDATGTSVTVMAEVPFFPSLVAVMIALPADPPVTRPLELTVATEALLVDHVTTRPVRVAPAASFVTAVSCCVAPTTMLADAGPTITEATGTCVTVMVALAVVPSLVAVTVAEPAAVAVTSPLLVTVATPGVSLDHVTTRPLSALPLASLGVAVSCAVAPASRLAVAGLTVSDATGTVVTVTAAVPLLPSLVAVIVAAPGATLVTSPVPLTVATAGVLLAQVTGRPGK